ncbi:MAG: hypothetical protein R3F43_16985 [bacterium]
MLRPALITLGGIGVAIVVRAAWGYGASDPQAVGLVLLVGVGLAVGLVEQWRRLAGLLTLQRALDGLPRPATAALFDQPPPTLATHLEAVRAGRAAPATSPGLTPYLLGALIMLGVLGTFLGLVQTMAGARTLMHEAPTPRACRAGWRRRCRARPSLRDVGGGHRRVGHAGPLRPGGAAARGPRPGPLGGVCVCGIATVFAHRAPARGSGAHGRSERRPAGGGRHSGAGDGPPGPPGGDAGRPPAEALERIGVAATQAAREAAEAVGTAAGQVGERFSDLARAMDRAEAQRRAWPAAPPRARRRRWPPTWVARVHAGPARRRPGPPTSAPTSAPSARPCRPPPSASSREATAPRRRADGALLDQRAAPDADASRAAALEAERLAVLRAEQGKLMARLEALAVAQREAEAELLTQVGEATGSQASVLRESRSPVCCWRSRR